MSYLKTRFTHCPNCDVYLCDMEVKTGDLCQLVAVCSNCNTEIAFETTEEVLA